MYNDLVGLSLVLYEKIKKKIDAKIKSKNIINVNVHHGEIFKTIYESPTDMTMIQIAKKLNRSRSDITQLSKKMIDNNLIRKVPSKTDKRKVYLKLTSKSQELLPVFINISKEIQAQIESVVGSTELEDLEKKLKKIVSLI